jgi:MOSC domain-containing protein YiiM
VTSAIWKEPAEGPVSIEGGHLAGDEQADLRVHGDGDKAIYAYAAEDYEWWVATTGPLLPGTFGENLTTAGIDLTSCDIGDRWHVGSAVLQVAQPREPCFKLGMRMEDSHFPGAFAAAGRPGTYLRVITPGAVAAGDEIEVVGAQRPAVRIGSLVEDPIKVDVLRLAVDDPRVPPGWRKAAQRALSS